MKGKLILAILSLLLVAGFFVYKNSDTELNVIYSANNILLIPGYGGSLGALKPLASELEGAGYTVFYPDLGEMKGDLKKYSEKVGELIKDSGERGERISIVAYSAGGLVARGALEDNELAQYIGRVITIGSPHNGSEVARLGSLIGGEICPLSCRQMSPDSDYIRELMRPHDKERWLSLRSSFDEVVTPSESSILSGASNYEISSLCGEEGVTHSKLVSNKSTARIIISFLKGVKLSC
jgi:triacylglycerol esterase/lipase EstA (alpha/beta hydrolase family)